MREREREGEIRGETNGGMNTISRGEEAEQSNGVGGGVGGRSWKVGRVRRRWELHEWLDSPYSHLLLKRSDKALVGEFKPVFFFKKIVDKMYNCKGNSQANHTSNKQQQIFFFFFNKLVLDLEGK